MNWILILIMTLLGAANHSFTATYRIGFDFSNGDIKQEIIINENIWRVSGYCSCKICCKQYANGITASGKKVKVGIVANNWLKFGTKVNIEGLGGLIVEDRGSIAYFGTKAERRKAIDIYFDKHEEAKEFGVQYLEVEVRK